MQFEVDSFLLEICIWRIVRFCSSGNLQWYMKHLIEWHFTTSHSLLHIQFTFSVSVCVAEVGKVNLWRNYCRRTCPPFCSFTNEGTAKRKPKYSILISTLVDVKMFEGKLERIFFQFYYKTKIEEKLENRKIIITKQVKKYDEMKKIMTNYSIK